MKAYCKAYPIAQLRAFVGWSAIAAGDVDAGVGEEGYAFVCEDLTLVLDPINESGVLIAQPSPEWRQFCVQELGFAIPDDLQAMLDQAHGEAVAAQGA